VHLPASTLIAAGTGLSLTGLLAHCLARSRASCGAAQARLRGLTTFAQAVLAAHSRDDLQAAVTTCRAALGGDPESLAITHAIMSLALDRRSRRDDLEPDDLHDALTGLANRELLSERLSVAWRARTLHGTEMSLLLLDLDDFRRVNDRLGRPVGDELLVAVAGRLRDCLRTTDTAARIGGDEFAVLLTRVDEEHVRRIAARILRSVSQPYRVGEHPVQVGASMGVATEADDIDALLCQADAAMYQAKAAGKECIRYDTTGAVSLRAEHVA
jgi:diguanylate cyclase (GGDEF)-like protein